MRLNIKKYVLGCSWRKVPWIWLQNEIEASSRKREVMLSVRSSYQIKEVERLNDILALLKPFVKLFTSSKKFTEWKVWKNVLKY